MRYKQVHTATYQKEKLGNDHCGDHYFFAERDQAFICAIADGLGSGEIAGESSQAVIEIIEKNIHISDNDLITKSMKKLAGKRGAVLGILRLDFLKKKYTYSSIGNISLVTTMNQKQRKRTIPKPGFLGTYKRQLKVVEGDLEKNMGFLMFSDGVSDQELSQLCFFNESVDEIIKAFSHMSNEDRDDDTTLIAMRYTKKADS